jgi:hypothetical protein
LSRKPAGIGADMTIETWIALSSMFATIALGLVGAAILQSRRNSAGLRQK